MILHPDDAWNDRRMVRGPYVGVTIRQRQEGGIHETGAHCTQLARARYPRHWVGFRRCTDAADAYLHRDDICARLPGRPRRSIRRMAPANAIRGDGAQRHRQTVQPLAAQAGLRILQQGGNAIDAAVATAAMLNVTFPQNVGIGGDLFALIYVAKEKKVYQLNASGIAPSGLTLDRMHSLGYKANAANFGPGSGMPPGGILTVTVPGSLWGWQEVLTRFGTKTFKDVLQPAIDYADQGFPDHGRDRQPVAHEERAAARRLLHAHRSGFGEDVLRQRQAASGRHDLQKSRSGEDVPADPAAGPRRVLQGRDRSRRSLRSRRRSAAR